MEQVDFPFIVKFYKSLKDSARIYFLLEYINGIEMFEVIRQIGLLSSAQCRFFICILVLSLEHLHQQRIVYRDLKPENILVDSQVTSLLTKGYAKLIDLGACKLIASSENDSSLKTYTIIGTPHYMAPEVLEGKGYNTRVDMWSLGVCMFEFMCGYLPFGEDAEDPYEIYHEISSK
jgi:cGMP-dependent protein kinase